MIIKFFVTFLNIFGLLWLLIESFSFLFNYSRDQIPPFIIWLAFIIPLLVGLIKVLESLSYSTIVNNSDIEIGYKIGNLLRKKGIIVVGVNTEFDTIVGNGVVSESSIHGQMINKFFKHQIGIIDNEIDKQLAGKSFINRKTKSKGKRKQYEIGSCVSLYTKCKKKIILLAITTFDDKCFASTTNENIDKALIMLWDFLKTESEGLNINIGIIGSGSNSRLRISRQESCYRIYDSFVAGSKNCQISERLNVIIHPQLLKKLKLSEINDYIKHISRHEIKSSNIAQGTNVQESI